MSDTEKLKYRLGDTTGSGQKVAFIYGQSTDVGVYRDEHGVVFFETTAELLTSAQVAANQKFDELRARLHECLPKSKRRAVGEVLALAFFRALSERNEPEAVAHFRDAQGLINHGAMVRARFLYVVLGSIATLVVASASIVTIVAALGADLKLLGVGALGGSVGAWTSVLERAARLEVREFETAVQHGFQGVTRILLGLAFGLLIVAASRANLVLGAAYTSEWAVAVVAYIAGFSERFVPEMIRHFERRNEQQSK